MAVRDSKTDVALLLIGNPSVIVNENAGHLGSPLHIAVVYHQVEIIEALLKRGADPNFRDNQGCTPMHKVIEIYTKSENVSQHIIDLLLQFGGNSNIKNSNSKTPLQMAIEEKKKEAIKGILKVWKAYSPNGDKIFDIKGDTLIQID